MQHYRVVVCDCGCSYNPEGRKECPATFCHLPVPENPADVEARLIAAEAELVAEKADKKAADEDKMKKARSSRKKASVS